jgi:hypothetical protein
MALRREWIGSPNYSSRGGARVRLVVLHTAEGALTYQSLGSWFSSPSSGVSSHTGIDDTPGVVGEYVRRGDKAWTAGNFNPVAVQAELCAFASWSTSEWDNHPAMLINCADWVREECAAFNIPIRRLSAAEAQGGADGVCQHVDLGAAGGGHWDCGPGFPMDDVLRMAATGSSATAPTKRKARKMIEATKSGEGYWTVTSDGAVYAFGDAQFKGSANDPDAGGPGKPHLSPGQEIIGIAGRSNDGYWLYASDGGIFTYGSANFYGRPDRV